ncbi:hypothetical protein RB195_000403 [Necator americanus]|uniref:Neurotransmitter-gated ion-channel ligand-binding domain-containing protein n=1 Tax=Necator americanus TaxID=51031 RepID=A0ABR1D9K2_NECAM
MQHDPALIEHTPNANNAPGYVRLTCDLYSNSTCTLNSLMLRVTVFWLALIPNYALTSCPIVALNASVELNAAIPRYESLVTLVFMKLIRMASFHSENAQSGKSNKSITGSQFQVEPEQKVDFLFEYAIDWRDERLQWNASEFCGIERIYLAMNDVWIPEITIVEAHSSQDYREDYKKFVWVNSSGHANYFVPTLTSTICTVEVRDFPFDHQDCSIKMMTQSFSAWEYGIKTVFSSSLDGNFSAIENMGNGEWQIKNLSVKTVFVDNGDEFPFEMNTFVIAMKRNASFFITMVIMPSFVINVLSIFGIFLKTADSMGKLGIALTNLMSLTFILGILATALPKTKDLPRIAIYVMVNLCIVVVALIATLLIPYLKQYLVGDGEIMDSTSKKKKRIEGKLFISLHIGSFILLEIANLINFIILFA